MQLATLGAWLLAPHTKSGQSLKAEQLLGWPMNWRVRRTKAQRADEEGGPSDDGDRDLRPARPGRRARSRE